MAMEKMCVCEREISVDKKKIVLNQIQLNGYDDDDDDDENVNR